jgi:hypothetical protein
MGEMGKVVEAIFPCGVPTAGREPPVRGQVMDRLREFLDKLREQGLANGHFLGLLHILIGRRISLADGTLVSSGQTWREVAALLKRVRWDREAVVELGIDPESLPPRDRQLYWFKAVVQAKVDSPAAIAAADKLAQAIREEGTYLVGATPAV